MAERPALALVLGGGNALGAYHAGAIEAFAAAGLVPDRIAGASIGAITGAILCGNPRDEWLPRLRDLWGIGGDVGDGDGWAGLDVARRTGSVLATMAAGRPGLFVPRNLYGPWWNPFARDEPSSLYDPAPLEATLRRLIDFDRLNRGVPRFAATVIDVDTGEDRLFDTADRRIGPDHIRASAALLPILPPVEIDGRLLGDAGISANLPLDTVLADPGAAPLLCVAIDLLPLAAPRPRTLGDTIARMQDLAFASQSRRAIAAWRAIYAARGATAPAVTLLYIAYRDQAREVSGKAFDFSTRSVAERWQAGLSDMTPIAARIAAGAIGTGRAGLTVWQAGADGLEPAEWPLAPVAV